MSNPFGCTCKNAHKFCRVPHCKCPLHKISPQEMVEVDPFQPTFHPGKDFDVDEDLLDIIEPVVLEDEEEEPAKPNIPREDERRVYLARLKEEFLRASPPQQRKLYDLAAIRELQLLQDLGDHYYPLRFYYKDYYFAGIYGYAPEIVQKRYPQVVAMEKHMNLVKEAMEVTYMYQDIVPEGVVFTDTPSELVRIYPKETKGLVVERVQENYTRFNLMKTYIQHCKDQEEYPDEEHDEFRCVVNLFACSPLEKKMKELEKTLVSYLLFKNSFIETVRVQKNFLKELFGTDKDTIQKQLQKYSRNLPSWKHTRDYLRLLKTYIREYVLRHGPLHLPLLTIIPREMGTMLESYRGNMERDQEEIDRIIAEESHPDMVKEGPQHWYERLLED